MKLNARAFIGALGLAFVSVPAMAHGLSASNPAAGATVSNLKTVSLQFSEPLDPKKSGAALTMTAMPGMAEHPPMKMSAMKPGFADGGKTLTLSSKVPLAAGSYRADWWATSKEGHRVTGQVSFTVK